MFTQFPFNAFLLLLFVVDPYNLLIINKARKIVIKFHNYSYEIVLPTVIVNSYKNVQNCYQIVKITVRVHVY